MEPSSAECGGRCKPNAMLFKTELCAFYQQGRCWRTRCTFAHGERELRARPDLSKTVMCHFVKDRGYCFNRDCRFAHDQSELRNVGRDLETKTRMSGPWFQYNAGLEPEDYGSLRCQHDVRFESEANGCFPDGVGKVFSNQMFTEARDHVAPHAGVGRPSTTSWRSPDHPGGSTSAAPWRHPNAMAMPDLCVQQQVAGPKQEANLPGGSTSAAPWRHPNAMAMPDLCVQQQVAGPKQEANLPGASAFAAPWQHPNEVAMPNLCVQQQVPGHKPARVGTGPGVGVQTPSEVVLAAAVQQVTGPKPEANLPGGSAFAAPWRHPNAVAMPDLCVQQQVAAPQPQSDFPARFSTYAGVGVQTPDQVVHAGAVQQVIPARFGTGPGIGVQMPSEVVHAAAMHQVAGPKMESDFPACFSAYAGVGVQLPNEVVHAAAAHQVAGPQSGANLPARFGSSPMGPGASPEAASRSPSIEPLALLAGIDFTKYKNAELMALIRDIPPQALTQAAPDSYGD